MTTPTNITVTEPTAGPRKQHWYSWTENTDLTSITIDPKSPPTPAMKSMAPIHITGSTYTIPALGPSGYSALASTGHPLDQPMPDTFDVDGPWPTGQAPIEAWTWQANITTGNVDIVAIGSTPPPPPDTIGTVIINGGVNVVVNQDGSFTLTATTSGGTVPANSLSYAWKLNGQPFPGAPNAASITVSPAEVADTGTWTCTVSSSVAGVTDVDGTLQVTVNGIIGNVSINGAGNYSVGDAITLEATYNKGAPANTLSYTWTLDGAAYTGPGANTDTISIASAATTDAGSWKCVISSSVAGVPSADDTVLVTVTSSVTIGNVQIQFSPTQPTGGYLLGTRVTATATAVGGTSQSITWTNNIPGVGAGTGNSVTVSAFELANAGNWEFTASDSNASDDPVTNSEAVSAGYLLNGFTFAAAYSLQRLESSMTASSPVVEVRETAGATFTPEQDIGTVSSTRLLDTVALSTHCHDGWQQVDGVAVTWYDQTGNGHHVSQSTATAQPKIFDAANSTIQDPKNNQAALDFDGVNDVLERLGANIGPQPITIFAVFGVDPTVVPPTRVRIVHGNSAGQILLIDTVGATPGWRIASPVGRTSTTKVLTTIESYITTTEFNGSSTNMWVKPKSATTSTQVHTNVNVGTVGLTGNFYIGRNVGAFHGGIIQEVLVATQVFSTADRVAIENEIASRY